MKLAAEYPSAEQYTHILGKRFGDINITEQIFRHPADSRLMGKMSLLQYRFRVIPVMRSRARPPVFIYHALFKAHTRHCRRFPASSVRAFDIRF